MDPPLQPGMGARFWRVRQRHALSTPAQLQQPTPTPLQGSPPPSILQVPAAHAPAMYTAPDRRSVSPSEPSVMSATRVMVEQGWVQLRAEAALMAATMSGIEDTV